MKRSSKYVGLDVASGNHGEHGPGRYRSRAGAHGRADRSRSLAGILPRHAGSNLRSVGRRDTGAVGARSARARGPSGRGLRSARPAPAGEQRRSAGRGRVVGSLTLRPAPGRVPRDRAMLKELARTYANLVEDGTRVLQRVKACSGRAGFARRGGASINATNERRGCGSCPTPASAFGRPCCTRSSSCCRSCGRKRKPRCWPRRGGIRRGASCARFPGPGQSRQHDNQSKSSRR